MLIRNFRYVVRSTILPKPVSRSRNTRAASCSWRFTQYGRVVKLKRSCVSRQVHEGGWRLPVSRALQPKASAGGRKIGRQSSSDRIAQKTRNADGTSPVANRRRD